MLIILAKSPLGGSLCRTLTGLCDLVARQAAIIRPMTAPLVALLVLAHGRLWRLAHRFDALALRWHAGTLPKRRVGPPRPPHPQTPRPHTAPRAHLRSGRMAWLIRLHQRTAQFAGQVEVFLAQPETRALAAEAPQAGRLLRPLCRALGLPTPDYLRLPPRPPRPVQPKPIPPKPAQAKPAKPRPGTAAAVTWRTYRPGRTRPPFVVLPPTKKPA